MQPARKPWIFGSWGEDKVKHLLGGVGLSIFGYLFISPLAGLLLGSVIGICKELIWDWYLRRGTPEVLDALCTIFGAALVWILVA